MEQKEQREKIYLSSPTMHGEEQKFVAEAFDTNWVAPLGPNVNNFEKEMAEYIVSRKDWDFASVEMGINMLYGNFTADQFEERVRSFVEVFSREERPVFATSIFGFNGSREFQEKAALFRKIVKKYAGEKLIFTDGLELLDNPAWISEDLIHPAVDGILQIADRWSDVMKKYGV
mgnify:CR=1 FL=1